MNPMIWPSARCGVATHALSARLSSSLATVRTSFFNSSKQKLITSFEIIQATMLAGMLPRHTYFQLPTIASRKKKWWGTHLAWTLFIRCIILSKRKFVVVLIRQLRCSETWLAIITNRNSEYNHCIALHCITHGRTAGPTSSYPTNWDSCRRLD